MFLFTLALKLLQGFPTIGNVWGIFQGHICLFTAGLMIPAFERLHNDLKFVVT